MQDYYAVLGVSPRATEGEIKEAYRSLVKQWHPDVCDLPEASARFIEITEAYKVLIDSEQRSRYDGHRSKTYATSADRSGSDPGEDYWWQDPEFRRGAHETAEEYQRMDLNDLLAYLASQAGNVARVAWAGDPVVRSEWTLGDTLVTGFKGVLLLAAIGMTLSGALTAVGIPFGYLLWRSLQKDGQWIGMGRLISSTLIFFLILLGFFVLLIVGQDGGL